MSFPVKKSLKGRRAVVLGSTLGGLAAAIALAVRGARVVVLERAARPAPFLQPTRIEEIEFGPWHPPLTSPAVLAELVSSAGLRLTDFLNLQRDEILARVRVGEETIALHHDPALLEAELERVAPGSSRRVGRLLRWLESVRLANDRLLRGRATGDWGELAAGWRALGGWLDPRSASTQTVMRHPEDVLRRALLSFHPLSGVLPSSRGGAYWRWLGDYLATGGWQVEGGMAELTRALLRLCDLLSIRIVCRARVEKIETRDGRVRQVVAGGAKDLAASLVVLADRQDPAQLLPLLSEIEGPRPPARLAMLTLRASFQQRLDFQGPICLVPSAEYREEARAVERWRVPAGEASLAVRECDQEDFAEEGSGGGQQLLVRSIVPVASSAWRWSEEQRDLEKRLLLERLEQGKILPNAAEHLEVAELDLEALPVRRPSPLWRSRRKGKPGFIGGLYLLEDWRLAGESAGNEILAGMALGVRAAKDAID
jgi:phytoene dehydrogenase-like protein